MPQPRHPAEPAARLFTPRQIAAVALATPVLLLALALAARALDGWADFDCPRFWPISEVDPHVPTAASLALGAAALLLLNAAWRALRKRGFPLPHVIALALALALVTSLMQLSAGQHGWLTGLVRPIAGGPPEIQYYHDALTVTDPVAFLRDYQRRQPGLLVHSRTHPPGAVLFTRGLMQLLRHPAAIAVAIAVISMTLAAVSLASLLKRQWPPEQANFATLVFLLLPGTQIYYLASIDALIAALLVASAALALGPPTPARRIGAALLLFAASTLTFAALFLPAVLAAAELLRMRSLRRTLSIVAGVVLAWVLVWLVTGFNYWSSFQIAAAIENPQGFRLLSEPLSYVMTRIECLADVAIHIGPFVLVLILRGLRRPPAGMLRFLPQAAIVVFVAMLLTGAFNTGETGRAALFLVPFLFALVPAGWGDAISPRDERLLANLVFGQTLCMQAAGDWFW